MHTGRTFPHWPLLSADEYRIWSLIHLPSTVNFSFSSPSILFPSQVFGFGRLLLGGTHRHKEVILWTFFWAHVQFFKIPFDPLRSQKPALVNIIKKLATPRAVLGARLLLCQAAGNLASWPGTRGVLRRYKQKWPVRSLTCEFDQCLHLCKAFHTK